MMANHPNRGTDPGTRAVLDAADDVLGSRRRITRRDMRDLLIRLRALGLVELDNGWSGARRSADDWQQADAWSRACQDITIISVLAPADLRAGSNPGDIRYDHGSGSMHPMMRAALMFVPADAEHGTDYLRRRCKRLLIVTGENEAGAR
ncbi:MAG: hypothetical protein IT337_12405 [Thermomicrobiales bacterium]|nr:hypothetical protein [Thermomicrobiales bacterium]